MICGKDCSCTECKNDEGLIPLKTSFRKKSEKICNCSKSKCMKKYCECYASGQKCG